VAFAFDSLVEMEEVFAGRREGFIYSRYDNPTLLATEARLAALEGAGGAVAFSSGMAALTAAFLSVAGAGDHIVAQEELYGGTTKLLTGLFARIGVKVTFAPSSGITELDRYLTPATRAVHVETPANPTLRVVDLALLAEQARRAGIALIVDNTFATPINQRPLALGASLVVHSASKYLAGHGDLLAGMVAGDGAALFRVHEIRKETGAVLDAETGWLLGRSLKTLALRVEAQNRNALALARLLTGREEVGIVHYPGLEEDPGHAIAARQMTGFGGMLSFELTGGAAAVARFAAALRLIRLLPTLGGVETSVLVPALSSHSMIPEPAREHAGITAGLVRISAGIEHIDDLSEEISEALRATR
jgi:cystathionine beta-lyase/cystathionine gamma-synthase